MAKPKNRQTTMLDYEGFVDKFKPKKTTDDCYTPEAVYEAVVKYVNDYVTPLEGVEVVRPFWPGGDYENYDYPDGCIVIDNPPFSIFTKIRRFYQLNGIRYFLFGPGLTMFQAHFGSECIHVINEAITFENGAKVNCSFVTNISNGDRIVLAGALDEALEDILESKNPRRVLTYPKGVVSSATLKKYVCKGVQYSIKDSDAFFVKDKNKPFGGAYVVPPQVVDELERERERERERELERELEQERERIIYIQMEPATMEVLRILSERYEERRSKNG